MLLETPISFISEKRFTEFNIRYIELREIVQGGPEVGKVVINDIIVPKYLFSGPFLRDENFIYLPVYLKKIFYKGFKVAKINFRTFEVEILGKFQNLLNLYKVDDNFLYYYTDLEGIVSKKIIK